MGNPEKNGAGEALGGFATAFTGQQIQKEERQGWFCPCRFPYFYLFSDGWRVSGTKISKKFCC